MTTSKTKRLKDLFTYGTVAQLDNLPISAEGIICHRYSLTNPSIFNLQLLGEMRFYAPANITSGISGAL